MPIFEFSPRWRQKGPQRNRAKGRGEMARAKSRQIAGSTEHTALAGFQTLGQAGKSLPNPGTHVLKRASAQVSNKIFTKPSKGSSQSPSLLSSADINKRVQHFWPRRSLVRSQIADRRSQITRVFYYYSTLALYACGRLVAGGLAFKQPARAVTYVSAR